MIDFEQLYLSCSSLQDFVNKPLCAKVGLNSLTLVISILLIVIITFLLSDSSNKPEKKSHITRKPGWVVDAVAKNADMKLVFAIRQDLPMSKGKVAAQVAHATLGVYKLAIKKAPDAVELWEKTGCAKITLKIKNDEELFALYKKAKSLDLTAYYVTDAGRTQIAANSETVLAIGPGPVDLINEVTGKLSLY